MTMKRQFAIFLVVSLIFVGLGLVYGSQVAADLTIFYPTSIDASEIKIVLSPDNASRLVPTSPQNFHLVAQDSKRIVAQRLDQLNLKGYYSIGIHDDQLEVTLPNNENSPYIINIITRVGEVEFIDGGTTSPPIGQQVRTGAYAATGEGIYQILFMGKEIASIIPPDTSAGEVFYQISLQPTATERFTNSLDFATNTNICLAIDKQVINCSKMYHWSDDTLDILPNLSDGTGLSLADLAIFLNSGPLPMSLEVITN